MVKITIPEIKKVFKSISPNWDGKDAPIIKTFLKKHSENVTIIDSRIIIHYPSLRIVSVTPEDDIILHTGRFTMEFHPYCKEAERYCDECSGCGNCKDSSCSCMRVIDPKHNHPQIQDDNVECSVSALCYGVYEPPVRLFRRGQVLKAIMSMYNYMQRCE